MNRQDFFYDLPRELIAQHPAVPRDASRLMRLGRADGAVSETIFRQLPEILRPGDLLVINDSRVIPARLLGRKVGTGGEAELLLLKNLGGGKWECLARPGRRLLPGARVTFGGGALTAEIESTADGGNRIVRFETQNGEAFEAVLDRVGAMPLPPYITAPLKNNDDYQTVYAKVAGSAAAPTAGFHFTPELMARLKEAGVGFAELTLHVGLGTFRPVKEDDISRHHMHSEFYTLPQATADAIAETKRHGGRVVAVGTTSCRVLESAVRRPGGLAAFSGETDIFIYPGFEFKVIDGLITNFHLPESTLIMLVSAFAGYDHTMEAYRQAVARRFRFFSFGDAMIIL